MLRGLYCIGFICDRVSVGLQISKNIWVEVITLTQGGNHSILKSNHFRVRLGCRGGWGGVRMGVGGGGVGG